MGLFSSENIPCPNCGHPGASKSLWTVRCGNRLCPDFDPALLSAPGPHRPASPPPHELIQSNQTATEAPAQTSGLVLRYRNHKSEQKSFSLHPETLRRRGEHVSACDLETYERLSFARKRIENLSEIDRVLSLYPEPTPHERQILKYYEQQGEASPAYEEIKRKYPHFED